MKTETGFYRPSATFPSEYSVVVTIDGRPEYVEAFLKAIRLAAKNFDGLEELPR